MGKAIVVGGGIGGLAAAIAFTRRGWEVEVLERAPELTAVGAGISLWINAVRALDVLGVGNSVRAGAIESGAAGFRGTGGEWLSRLDIAGMRDRFGLPIVLHRADLLEILRAAVPESAIRTGVMVYSALPDGTVVHSEGESTGDVVVGADGIHSVVRRAVAGVVAPVYAGYTAWRVVVTPTEPVHEFGETLGRGERFGILGLPDERIYCFATASVPERLPVADDLAELLRRFGGWHDPIPGLLAAADPAAVLRHDIQELPPLKTFVADRIALLGDAAHAMTPTLGQGACQAIEDAVVLARVADAGRDLTEYDRIAQAAAHTHHHHPFRAAGDGAAIPRAPTRCRA
ncbi:FAD-dependent monooxygenase [Microbacterium aurum]